MPGLRLYTLNTTTMPHSIIMSLSRLYGVIYVFIVVHMATGESEKLRVAIIGSGMGGAASAFHLRELFDENITIDVYEASRIGGRLATAIIDGREYEVGGSVIHPKNKLVGYYADILNLSKLTSEDDESWALYNGKEAFFAPSSSSWMQILELLWRYGMSIMKFSEVAATLVDQFTNIYNCLDAGNALPKAADFSPNDHVYSLSLKEYLEEQGVSNTVIDELATASTLVNYGQQTSIHGFVGTVSLAAADGLWRVKGGNRLIPENLIKTSKANLKTGFVEEIRLSDDKNSHPYILFYNTNPTFDIAREGKAHDTGTVKVDCDGPCQVAHESYDYIIVATPLTWDKGGVIKMTNFPHSFDINGQYHRTTTTLVKGYLNETYFSDVVRDQMFFIKNSPLLNSISKLRTVEGLNPEGPPVYKLFSQNTIAEDLLDTIFKERLVTQTFDWLAYPDYTSKLKTGSFVLHDHLFYLNHIETLASAMEMSALAGKNCAQLVYNDHNHIHNQDTCFYRKDFTRTDL